MKRRWRSFIARPSPRWRTIITISLLLGIPVTFTGELTMQQDYGEGGSMTDLLLALPCHAKSTPKS